MSQGLPVYNNQPTLPPPSKDPVYPEPIITETPEKPHSYDDDVSVPNKPHTFDEPKEPAPPSYPTMKPNAPDQNLSPSVYQNEQQKQGTGGSGPTSQNSSRIQGRNSTRSAPSQYNPEVGSNIANLSDEEESKGAFLSSFQRKKTIKNNSTRDPLNPLPECFDRQPEFSTTPQQFATFYLRSLGKYVDKGFPTAFPGAQFGSHDIYPEEWTQFLDDVTYMGKLSGGQKVMASVFPVTRYVGFVGHTLTTIIENSMRKGKHGRIASLIDIWNAVFFNPRGVNVVLLQGATRISGPPVEENPLLSSPAASPTYNALQSAQEYPQYSSVAPFNAQQQYHTDLGRVNSISSQSSHSSMSTVSSPGGHQNSPSYNEMLGRQRSLDTTLGQHEQSYQALGQQQMPQPTQPYVQSQPAQPAQPYQLPLQPQLQTMSQPYGYNASMSYSESRRRGPFKRAEERSNKKNKDMYLMIEYRQPTAVVAPPPM
ncbi:hypothetical protein BGW37DRAFT_485113 [Umbelopsis sp. PMI_123]|nr:hypothetical protein BGW37DRAFT_485113 [Umbelopsis sp. PMI_123]